MRIGIFVGAIVVGAAAMSPPAQAQSYPWCANYSMRGGGVENCGFTSFAQCQADVSGVGGFCERNTQYRDPLRPRYRHR